MSAGNDNPFARWSRRKLAAREAEAPLPEEARPEAKAQEDAERGDLQSTPAEPDGAEPPEPLPRLEDLTAESEVTAFLRKGVPGALRNIALRKMWTLDPAIRDYVGPAEYAWDFNKPGSMAGFGPLEAGKSVANFLSKAGSSDPQDTVAEPQSEPPGATTASSDEDVAALPETEASVPAAEPAQPANPLGTSQSNLSQSHVDEAATADKPAPAESPRTSAVSRHGGALPR
ncbi:DUF3306 domain-containing protein [Chelativorans xinjiangense]|uniref:DUF3306 domain-containing protein n=1 Tax=Chelativorans xinjiangense TaxID=2681485 RepID=UPI0013570D23|nr:DUF3306 domain-containing protein [Chelativorans xinjiangense]